MTIKRENCKLCANEGVVTKIVSPPVDWSVPLDLMRPWQLEEKVLSYCECEWGQLRKKIDERERSPDYVNPLTGLADEQILAMIDLATGDQKSIDKEFNI